MPDLYIYRGLPSLNKKLICDKIELFTIDIDDFVTIHGKYNWDKDLHDDALKYGISNAADIITYDKFDFAIIDKFIRKSNVNYLRRFAIEFKYTVEIIDIKSTLEEVISYSINGKCKELVDGWVEYNPWFID